MKLLLNLAGYLNLHGLREYALTESVKIDKNRIDIYEQEDGNTDESTITGGWLVEIDNYDDPYQEKIMQDPDGEAFEKGFTHKSPEVLSDLQREWLINELTTITNAIYVKDKTDMTWTNHINIESLTNYYLVQELTGNLDAFIGSTYMYKDLNKKWEFGPLWDMGWSFNEDSRERALTFVEQRTAICEYCPFTWITELWKFPQFRNAVYKRWNFCRIICNQDIFIIREDSCQKGEFLTLHTKKTVESEPVAHFFTY